MPGRGPGAARGAAAADVEPELPPTVRFQMKEDELFAADMMASFKYVCITILEIGNFLNTASRPKAFCVGYKMESLLKTGDTKSPYRKGVTLLTYVAIHCQKAKPEAINMPDDMHPCSEAFAYPYDMLSGDISKISQDIKKMAGFVKMGEKCKEKNPDDKWAEQCSAFMNTMKEGVAALEQTVNLLQERVKSICVLFASKPDPKAGDDIFKKIDQFCTMFSTGVKFLEDEEAKRLKELEKKRKAEEKVRLCCGVKSVRCARGVTAQPLLRVCVGQEKRGGCSC
jgi:hypothetical protein|eukprot:SAG25_NODE_665_length_6064_cov_2064.163621_6_plen_283_part_00